MLVAAIHWLQGVLLGPTATTVAIIAIAAIGFHMMQGRLPMRRGIETIAGCFLLFGAPVIAAGIIDATRGVDAGSTSRAADQFEATAIPPAPKFASPKPPPGYDPYAGASLMR